MDKPTVGILHPGSMGAAIAARAATQAAAVVWCSEGRSAASTARAEKFGLTPVATLTELLDRRDIVIGLCPPAAAESLAREVSWHSFGGVFVEANAINPERTKRIAGGRDRRRRRRRRFPANRRQNTSAVPVRPS